VRQELGAVAVIGELNFVGMLPKTRSGKIMRRVLKAVVLDKDPGDITTIEDEGSVEEARQAVAGADARARHGRLARLSAARSVTRTGPAPAPGPCAPRLRGCAAPRWSPANGPAARRLPVTVLDGLLEHRFVGRATAAWCRSPYERTGAPTLESRRRWRAGSKLASVLMLRHI
jgi:hypothetical protein